ncbi:uncharacterized protein [Clytia hemisphaerica]|uniref:uncharacterized protein n=1 Tax=Clytia hemisphaerica TaxID=252671 RepID=UPI0034D7B3D4
MSSATKEKNLIQEENEQLKESLSKKEHLCLQLQEILNEKSQQIVRMQHKETENRSNLNTEVKNLRSKKSQLENRVSDLEKAFYKQLSKIKEFESQFKEMKERRDISMIAKEEEIAELKQQNEFLKNEMKNVQNDVYTNPEITTLRTQLMREVQKNKQLQQDLRNVDDIHRNLENVKFQLNQVKLSLRSSKPSKPNPLKQIDWKRASTNPEVCSMFGIEVFNRFSTLFNEELTKDNVELAYSCLKDSTEKVALEQLPRKQKRAKSDPKECPLVKKARENLTKASSLYNAAPTRRRKEQLNSAKIKLDEAYLEAQVSFIDTQLKDMSEQFSKNSHRDAWKVVQQLSGKNSKPSIQLKGGSDKKRLDNWLQHFKNLLEEARNFNLEAILIFVDFKKAFDSVDRDSMFDILSLYGIPQKIIDAIKLLYTNTKSSVQTPDDTDFADDIALISSTLEDAQNLLITLESAANCTGLYLNESKTEYLTLNVNESSDNIKTISGTNLRKVEDYKYLGSYISSSEKDFKVRKAPEAIQKFGDRLFEEGTKNVGHQRVITEVTKVLTCSSSPGDNEQTNILVNAMKTFKENFDDFRSYTISIQEKLKTQSSLDLSQSPSANNSSPTTSISNKLLRHLQNRVQQLRHENIQLKENLKNSLTNLYQFRQLKHLNLIRKSTITQNLYQFRQLKHLNLIRKSTITQAPTKRNVSREKENMMLENDTER